MDWTPRSWWRRWPEMTQAGQRILSREAVVEADAFFWKWEVWYGKVKVVNGSCRDADDAKATATWWAEEKLTIEGTSESRPADCSTFSAPAGKAIILRLGKLRHGPDYRGPGEVR